MCSEVTAALIFIESSVLMRMWKEKINHINRRKEPGKVGLVLYNLNLIKDSLNIFSLSAICQNQAFGMTDNKCLKTVSTCICDS